MEDNTHRIRVKIGEAEFDAEGSPEAVNDQYKSFLEAVNKAGTSATKPPASAPENGNGSDEPEKPSGDGKLSDQLLSTVFHEQDGFVSLSALPRTDQQKADSLVLLLYGYAKLADQTKVTGVTLMKAAKQSGVQIDRVDRVINVRQEYVLSAGHKRGKRYQLNNQGIKYAEDLIREIV